MIPDVKAKSTIPRLKIHERKAIVLFLILLLRFQYMNTGASIINNPLTIMNPETALTPASLPSIDIKDVIERGLPET
jgi:hypothetical protein